MSTHLKTPKSGFKKFPKPTLPLDPRSIVRRTIGKLLNPLPGATMVEGDMGTMSAVGSGTPTIRMTMLIGERVPRMRGIISVDEKQRILNLSPKRMGGRRILRFSTRVWAAMLPVEVGTIALLKR